jgi:hypothetical protein
MEASTSPSGPIRTYAEVAAILKKRVGKPITPEWACRLEKQALQKIRLGLLEMKVGNGNAKRFAA